METNTAHDFDCDCDTCIGDEEDDGGTYEPVPPPSPKEQFTSLVQQILRLAESAQPVYDRLQTTAAPFDRELAEHLRMCQVADQRLIAYCQKKVEQAKG